MGRREEGEQEGRRVGEWQVGVSGWRGRGRGAGTVSITSAIHIKFPSEARLVWLLVRGGCSGEGGVLQARDNAVCLKLSQNKFPS